MRRSKRVVLALGTFREARKPAFLPQRAHAIATAGEYLVRIGLMADIPNQPVFRRVEDVVKCHRQLDHAKTRAEMAARMRHDVDQFGAQLRGKLGQIAFRKPAKIRRHANLVQ